MAVMTTVLVVDDSSVDRCMVGGILAKDPDLTVQYAPGGKEALETVATGPPDLVVTDLMMPDIDGLELVVALKESHPLIPSILITSQGSEEIAVKALQQGAASYVPKRKLAEDLIDTVRQVLAHSTQKRVQSRLMGCMTQSRCSLVLENDCTLFGPLVNYLQDGIAMMGLCGEGERTRLAIALEEALSNALYHGNLEVSSELKEQDCQGYFELVRSRRHQPPYSERRIHVDAALSRDEAVIVVRDEGTGFDPAALPDPTDPANLEKATGRGILLMRTFMSHVAYNESGNAVTLVKRRNNGDAGQGEEQR